MSSELEKVISFVDKGVDFKYFLESGIYHSALFEDRYLSNFLVGKTFNIKADIRYFTFGFSANLVIHGMLCNKPITSLGSYEGVSIVVPVELFNEFMSCKILPDTCFICKADVVSFDSHLFTLNSIIEYNKPLMYPYHLCMKDNPNKDSASEYCGKLNGFYESDDGYCPLCGSSVKKVYDIYGEGLAVNPYLL